MAMENNLKSALLVRTPGSFPSRSPTPALFSSTCFLVLLISSVPVLLSTLVRLGPRAATQAPLALLLLLFLSSSFKAPVALRNSPLLAFFSAAAGSLLSLAIFSLTASPSPSLENDELS